MMNNRFKLVAEKIRDARTLHNYIAIAHPDDPNGYPDWYRWTHIRSYFCTLTGGCAWGPLYDENGNRAKRFCWKCQSTWVNPLMTQHDRPWRALHPSLYPLEAVVRRRRERRLEKIGKEAKK